MARKGDLMQTNSNPFLMIALAVAVLFSLLVSALVPMHIHVYDHSHAHEHNTGHYSTAHPVHDTSHKKHGHNVNTIDLNTLIDGQLNAKATYVKVLKIFILTAFVLFAVKIIPLKTKVYIPYIPIFSRWKVSSPPPLRAPPF